MKTSSLKFIFLLFSISLSACSSTFFPQTSSTPAHHAAAKNQVAENDLTPRTGETVNNAAVAGNLEYSMDEIDKSKMFRALDKAPGKSTQWVNANTGITYTVVPTEKVVVNGNPYCRKYTTTASRNSKEKQFGGTACISANGGWEPVNN